jgi:hypothetical protein
MPVVKGAQVLKEKNSRKNHSDEERKYERPSGSTALPPRKRFFVCHDDWIIRRSEIRYNFKLIEEREPC